MPTNVTYIARVLTGVRWKKLNYILGVVKEKSGHSKFTTFFDILWCAARYGAGVSAQDTTTTPCTAFTT